MCNVSAALPPTSGTSVCCFCENILKVTILSELQTVCALSVVIWDLFDIFSVGVLTGQPPQPGNRCVSEPLISI